jgi:hypothetical protein
MGTSFWEQWLASRNTEQVTSRTCRIRRAHKHSIFPDTLRLLPTEHHSGRATKVEAVDGFFAALIAGPENVMPSEDYAEVFDGVMLHIMSSAASMRRTKS